MYEYPSKTITLKIEGKDKGDANEYDIKFPNTGELMRIQTVKASLLKGQLGSILEAGTIDGDYVSILSGMIATLTVCCPKIVTDLSVDSLTELEAIDSARLLKVYIEQYLPWYNEWREILQNGGVPLKKNKKVEGSEDDNDEVKTTGGKKGKPVLVAPTQ